MAEKIKVYRMRPHSLVGRIIEIEHTLEALQKEVGGYIDIVPLDESGELDLYVHDEGKLIGLPVNRVWLIDSQVADILVGTVFVARHDNEGNTISIRDSDVETIESILRPIVTFSHKQVSYIRKDFKGIAIHEFKK